MTLRMRMRLRLRLRDEIFTAKCSGAVKFREAFGVLLAFRERERERERNDSDSAREREREKKKKMMMNEFENCVFVVAGG